MAKQAKLPQTDWTRGGMQISNAAVPQYTASINRLGGYLDDPYSVIDKNLEKYYGANAIQNQDMLRAYNRAMGDQVGRNYAATGGGYTSSGQRAWNDRQSTWNDLVARLNQYGVKSARDMYDQDVINEMNAQQAYNNAYGLGKNYSAIETQNYLVDQANKNWWSNLMSAAGGALQNVPNPYAQAAGAALSTAGGMTAKDFGSANAGYASIYGGTAGVGNNDTFTNLMNNLNATGVLQKGQDWLGNKLNGTKGSGSSSGINTNAGNSPYFKMTW